MVRESLAAVLLFFCSIYAGAQQTPTRHRVAVLSFNHSKVLTSSEAIFGENQDVGMIFADMLANRLTMGGAFRVIDRTAILRALATPLPTPDNSANDSRSMGSLLNLRARDEAPPSPISKIGAVLGVNQLVQYFEADTVITGEIVAFGRDSDKKKGVLSNLEDSITKGCKKRKAVLGVSARMIDLNTGDILSSANVKAESQHSNCALLTAKGFLGNVSSMNDSNFSKTILGEAVAQAIHLLAQTFEKNAPVTNIIRPLQLSGLVADVNDSTVTINIGAIQGVHLGDILLVTRTSKQVKDPVTGSTIRTIEDTVGQLTITSVSPFFSLGSFSGDGTVVVNDRVKNVP